MLKVTSTSVYFPQACYLLFSQILFFFAKSSAVLLSVWKILINAVVTFRSRRAPL